jgi:hypothetical protein
VEGEGNHLVLRPPPVDNSKATMNHPGYIIFKYCNIKYQGKLYVHNLGKQVQKKNLASICHCNPEVSNCGTDV